MSKKTFITSPVSPLFGGTIPLLFKTLRGKEIPFKYYPKLLFTFIVCLIFLPARLIDLVYFKKRIQSQKLDQPPIFIIGHWRSGTTFLHNVLCQSPSAAYVTTYQTVLPHALKSQSFFKSILGSLLPKTRPTDNVKMSFDFPQEDEFALSNITPSNYYKFMYFPRFYSGFYNKYIRFEVTQNEKLKWRKSYLNLIKKALINSKGDQIILKNPANTGRIKFLLEMFPNAKFIYLHRNPITVYLSTLKFFKTLFKDLQLHEISEDEIHNLILDVYHKLTSDYLSQKSKIPRDQLYEIRFEDFEKNTLYKLKEIYTSLNIEGWETDKSNFERYLNKKKNYKKNQYKIEEGVLKEIKQKWEFSFVEWSYELPSNIEVINT